MIPRTEHHEPGCDGTAPTTTRTMDRGDTLTHCTNCRTRWILDKPLAARPAPTPSRYHLDCVRCGYVIALHRPEPRVPVCYRCKQST